MAAKSKANVEIIKKNDWPRWASSALQGLSYWMGHRQAIYPHYPLVEGALVGELCNLISANLSDAFSLHCEVMYSTLLKMPAASTKSVLTQRARADLVVSDAQNGTPLFIIETKRLSAGNAEINADLRRLAEVKRKIPDVRAYLFLISESIRPTRFVKSNGGSIKGMQGISGDNGHYRTRRTLKAAPAYSDRDVGQYCCLIEVFAKKSVFKSKDRRE